MSIERATGVQELGELEKLGSYGEIVENLGPTGLATSAGANTGVDKLRIVIPIRGDYSSSPGSPWKRSFTTERIDRRGWVDQDAWTTDFAPFGTKSGMPFEAQYRAQQSETGIPNYRVLAEFNPAKICGPEAWSLAGLEVVPLVIEEVFAELRRHHCYPSCEPLEAQVNRLDWTRNVYDVEDPGVTILALSGPQRAWHPPVIVFRDGAPQTLQVGNGEAGHVTLYDKHRQTKGAPRGMMRAEILARRGWLNRYNIHQVSDLSEFLVRSLARDKFAWSMMENVMVSESSLIEISRDLTDDRGEPLSPRTRLAFLDYQNDRVRGRKPTCGVQSQKKYDAMVRGTRLVLAPPEAGNIEPRRLDLKLGRELRGEDALAEISLS